MNVLPRCNLSAAKIMKFERRISSLREYYAEMQLILSKEEILVVAVIFAIIYEIHLVMALEVFIVI